MNPVEAHVLAHQPINGATYVAAKLTHLVRILLYLVPAMNAIPAFGGLLLEKRVVVLSARTLGRRVRCGGGLGAALLCDVRMADSLDAGPGG